MGEVGTEDPVILVPIDSGSAARGWPVPKTGTGGSPDDPLATIRAGVGGREWLDCGWAGLEEEGNPNVLARVIPGVRDEVCKCEADVLKNALDPGEFMAGGVANASRDESGVKAVERGEDW
jgi:hypothetical protein